MHIFYKFGNEGQVWCLSVDFVYHIHPRFLSRDLTTAVFHCSQNCPIVRDRLAIWVVMGRQPSSICLRVLVRMKSSSQCLFFMFIITVDTSTTVSGRKDANLGESPAVQPCMLVCWWMFPLFSQYWIWRIWQRLLPVPHLFCWVAWHFVLCGLLVCWLEGRVLWCPSCIPRLLLLIDCFLK